MLKTLSVSYHLRNAAVCHNVAGMYEPVEHLCRLLNQVTLVGVVFQFIVWTERRRSNA